MALFCICFFAVSKVHLLGQSKKEMLYVGTFSERYSKGIYAFEFDRAAGTLTLVQTTLDRESPTYLELHPNGKYLYAANRQGTDGNKIDGSLSAFRIRGRTGKLTLMGTVSSGGVSPCHVSISPNGQTIFVSHYASSHMSIYRLRKNGRVGSMVLSKRFEGSSINADRQSESHLHSIVASLDGRFIYASDLGTDRIYQYGIGGKSNNPKIEFIESVFTNAGAGPRHFSIHPSGQFGFSVEELSSTVSMYCIDPNSGRLTFQERVGMIGRSDDFRGINTAADIQISLDGRFVYASNRGLDNIAIFGIDQESAEISYIGEASSLGRHPRGFAMDKLGEYLFVTNRETDNLVVLGIDGDTGMLKETGIEVKVPGAAVVKQLLMKKR